MALTAQGAVARLHLNVTGRKRLIDKYFYFAMSLVVAAIVGVGFNQTVDASLP